MGAREHPLLEVGDSAQGDPVGEHALGVHGHTRYDGDDYQDGRDLPCEGLCRGEGSTRRVQGSHPVNDELCQDRISGRGRCEQRHERESEQQGG